MSLSINCTITCNYSHHYREPECGKNRTQAQTTADWNPKLKDWDIQAPDGWHIFTDEYICPKCWAPIEGR